MEVNFEETIEFLKNCDNIYVLTHQNPDGDTLGSGFALVNVLRQMGKKANVLCNDQFPYRYSFLYAGYYKQEFEPETVIAVDLADRKLFGNHLNEMIDKVDLCIDHHISNTMYAQRTLLRPNASAACEILYELFVQMGVNIDLVTARCLYTGMATDTGCFKYDNTTPETHIAAAELMRLGVEYGWINRKMFDVKSKARIQVEHYLTSNMEYYMDDRCAIITITKGIIEESGLGDAEFDGIASLTLQVEGVEVGVVIKEKEPEVYKVSMRSSNKANVSEICQKMGGGGHIKAAGCLMKGPLEDVKKRIIEGVKEAIEAM